MRLTPPALLAALGLLSLTFVGGGPAQRVSPGAMSEVVVTLAAPPLAGSTDPSAAAAVDREQERFAEALVRTIPSARVRWRYRIVLNGAAVVVPTAWIGKLSGLPGVTSVDTSAAYPLAAAAAATHTTERGWRAGLPNQGAGMKIGIIDDGVDQTHPYFAPGGYTMPAGFPKGQTAYTTAKVIVARAFAPAGTTYRNARKPFDPGESGHATHVAGIAAGNANTPATGGVTVSGVAPRASIGNYKALGIPTDAGVGLDGNAAEIVAAIEAAVADGMNVINLSIGEPEIEPTRDIVALALDAAARAGVVPVVAAGNDFADFGNGSLSSPGTSEGAITVAAIAGSSGELAGFSGSGPTPLSLRLKPDLSAPGVSVLSSVPGGRWESMSGTSMASPQIAGAAALLRERHPDWTVAQLKAALVETGTDVTIDGKIAPPTRGGGGLADPQRADAPLIFTTPSSVSFGLVHPGATPSATIGLADAGGGDGLWSVAVQTVTAPAGATLTAAPSVTVPGTLTLTPEITAVAEEGPLTGFVSLSRGVEVRRIPFWLRVSRPALAAASATRLRAPGIYAGNTQGGQTRVSHYRYPEVPAGGPVSSVLEGPEQVFRLTLARPVTNFGVVITRRGSGVRVEPRVVVAGDENRLTGYAALPVNLNPYLAQFGDPVLAAGAVRPLAGDYDVVFDSPTPDGAGRYGFRYWVDDTRPPTVAIAQTRVRRGLPIAVRIGDRGSGIDPSTLKVSIDGTTRAPSLRSGIVRVPTATLRRGKHRFRLQVSDYQESRNMENVPPILPNTRIVTAIVTIR